MLYLDDKSCRHEIADDRNDRNHRVPDLAVYLTLLKERDTNETDDESQWEPTDGDTEPRDRELEFQPERTEQYDTNELEEIHAVRLCDD